MVKKFEQLTFTEMVEERKRVLHAMRTTKNEHLRRDYYKYLLKIDKELAFYKRYYGRSYY